MACRAPRVSRSLEGDPHPDPNRPQRRHVPLVGVDHPLPLDPELSRQQGRQDSVHSHTRRPRERAQNQWRSYGTNYTPLGPA